MFSLKRFNGFLSKVWVRLRTPTGTVQHPGPGNNRELFLPRLEGAVGGDNVIVCE